MKKTIIFSMLVLALCACKKNAEPGTEPESTKGTLVFSGITYDDEIPVKSFIPATDSCIVFLTQGEDTVVNTTYEKIKAEGNKLSLEPGEYVVNVTSLKETPEAAFEMPVYTASVPVTVVTKETVTLDLIVCEMKGQSKVTVEYSNEFLDAVTADGAATLSLDEEESLVYALSYNEGAPVYETRAGYFEVSASSIFEAKFVGELNGEPAEFTKIVTDFNAGGWYKVKFIISQSEEGNAAIDIKIENLTEDPVISTPVEEKPGEGESEEGESGEGEPEEGNEPEEENE